MEKERKKLEIGEKYLSILITFGESRFKFVAFPNDSENNKAPQFSGKNISVWVNRKMVNKKDGGMI